MTETSANSTTQAGKPWYQSRTVWAAIITVLAVVLGEFGVPLTEADQAEVLDNIMAVVAGGGGLAAVYFRLAATKALR